MKAEIIAQINRLPLFELKEIAVKHENEYIDNKYLRAVIQEGKPERIISIVSDKYKLVQFKDVFIPAIEKIEEIEDGLVLSYLGKAYLEIYPKGEEFKLNNGERVGLVLRNSVDKAWAIQINFCISSANLPTIILPNTIKGLRKVHVGKIEITKDFIEVINKVKEIWKIIVEKFTQRKFELEELEDFAKITKIGERIKRKLEKKLKVKELNLWEVFVFVIKEIAKRKYKSELHKKEKLQRITNAIFKYAIIEEI